jgi:2'-5' RNA ligase
MSTVRAFIAIELSTDVLAQIGRLQARVRQDLPPGLVRWTRPEGIHLTLKVLGDVETEHLPEIKRALCGACASHTPFALRVGALGCFPNPRRPRVLWVGVEESGERLAQLQRDVERALVPLGYPTDRRGYHPHLTLGRIKTPRNAASRPNRKQAAGLEALGDYVERASKRGAAKRGASGRGEAIRVEDVHLMRSELLPGGAVYSALARCPLAGHG